PDGIEAVGRPVMIGDRRRAGDAPRVLVETRHDPVIDTLLPIAVAGRTRRPSRRIGRWPFDALHLLKLVVSSGRRTDPQQRQETDPCTPRRARHHGSASLSGAKLRTIVPSASRNSSAPAPSSLTVKRIRGRLCLSESSISGVPSGVSRNLSLCGVLIAGTSLLPSAGSRISGGAAIIWKSTEPSGKTRRPVAS